MFKKLKNIYKIIFLRFLFYLQCNFGGKKSMDFPIEIKEEEKEIIKLSDKYTMTDHITMWALIQSIKNVIQNKIDGDFVECGVWRGGNLILCQKYFDLQHIKKKIYGFDTFEGMVEPKEIDIDYRNIPASEMYSLFKKDILIKGLSLLTDDNVQNEYYLTQIFESINSNKVVIKNINAKNKSNPPRIYPTIAFGSVSVLTFEIFLRTKFS